MNNLQMAKDFIEGCDTITSLFVGLGKQDKLYSLYANWKETVWGKTESGVPIARVQYKTQHLVNLAIDFAEAQEKAKVFCKSNRCINLLYLAKEPSKQNPYDFRTPEEIAEEKAEKIRYEKTIDDIRWVRRMSDRFVWEDKHKLRGTFDIALENKLSVMSDSLMNYKEKKFLANKLKQQKLHKSKRKHFQKAKQISLTVKNWKPKAIQQAKKTNFVGSVGEKLEVELTVQKITGYSTHWNYVNIYTMVDNDGNIFVYKGSADLADKSRSVWKAPVKEGHKIIVSGKVKEHNKYRPRNFEKLCFKQTRLERIKVLKSLNTDNMGRIVEGVV
jgi:hypothetical protein